MTLDDLKTDWQALDQKVQATQTISNQLALSMMNDRSRSTVANMQRTLLRVAFFFITLLLLFAAILLGNPFDYTHWVQYIPAILYAILVITALLFVWRAYVALRNITLTNSSLHESLKTIIEVHEHHLLTMNKVWRFSLGAGFLLSLSLFARNFEAYGWLKSTGLIAGQGVTIVVMYALARWFFGQLPDAHLTALRAHYCELEEMK